MGDYTLLLIVIRGSGQMFVSDDWPLDFEAMNLLTPEWMGVHIHSGFYKFATEVEAGINDHLDRHPEILEKLNAGRLKVVVTGHSLGGAASNLIGAFLESDANYDDLQVSPGDLFVYSFATPRVFTTKDNRSREFEPEFSTAYRCLNLFNIVISQDPVPNFPKDLYHWGMWYRFGVTLLFESSYFSISPGDYHRPQNYINVVTNGQSYEQFQKQWKGIFISNAE